MTTYRNYKSSLRSEFRNQCAYCQTREPEMGGAKSFHIDHYRPKDKFPSLINCYSNLIYACRDCNNYKGDYWPNLFEQLLGHYILNPRDNNIEIHIDTSVFIWQGKTTEGKWTIKKLKLDSAILAQRREDRIRIENKIREFEIIVEDAKNKQERAKQNQNWDEFNDLETFVRDEGKTIESLRRKIIGPMD